MMIESLQTLSATSALNNHTRTHISSILQKRLYPNDIRTSKNESSIDLLSSYDIMSRSMKSAAQLRATQNTIQEIRKHIKILYRDDHICVINKPSGILSVPGPRRHANICEALYYLLHPSVPYHETKNNIPIDQMVVHRLDMDTSGIMIFALSKEALRQLHTDFRLRQITKVYQALLCNHVVSFLSRNQTVGEYEIDVDLERDPNHPPFMRIAQHQYQPRDPMSFNSTVPSSPPPQAIQQQLQQPRSRYNKFLNEESKPSLTEMQVLRYEYIKGTTIPVTRVQLVPRTGRTHQLRVHMAQVLQYPIVGDDIYGYGGECYRREDINHQDNNNNNKNNHNNNQQDLVLNDVPRQLAELGLPLCLHAQKLYFRHPISGVPMIFECQPHF